MSALINKIFNWLEKFSEPFPAEQPEKPPDDLSGFMLHYVRPFKALLIAVVILGVCVATLEVLLFAFVGKLVDWLGVADKASFYADHKYQIIGMSFLVLVILPALKFFYNAVSHQGLLGNFAMRIRWQAHRYLLRQSVDFFQNDFAGRIATKMMQTALGVRDSVMKVTQILVYVVVYFTATLLLFASSDIRLTAPMLFWFVGYMITLIYFVPKLRKLSMEQAEARSAVTGRVVDSYSNITTVKMFSDVKYEDEYAREGMTLFLDNVYLQMRLSTNLNLTLNLLNSFLIFSVAAISIGLWQVNSVSVGAIAFALGVIIRLQGMAQWTLWEISSLFENIGVVQDGIETIARERAIVDSPDARPLEVTQGKISFESIVFNYNKVGDDSMPGVIENLTLTVQPGEKIGIVGRSGAGKSTLVNLLLRFYDLKSGKIYIDDQDISKVTQRSLRNHIGMVTQDTSLLHRSVLENIRYGSENSDRQAVTEAAIKARANDFIAGLEDLHGRRGYDAHVGERGVKLSGGQRQRIAIARVLLKNAPILVLDEATSALDSEVEAAIQESLYSLMEGKTVIAIAHRLSTIAAMDRLVIMDKGRIVEQGSHDMLLQSGGLYSELWARQSGGFLAQDSYSTDPEQGAVSILP